MPEAPAPVPGKSKQRLLLIWAIAATLATVLFANAALLLFVRTRELSQRSTRDALKADSSASPFLTLHESEVPGRYRFFENGEEMGIMTLNPDHKFINKDGTTYPQYRWVILRDGLMICWQRAHTTFTEIERPGVYVARTPKYQRLEKIVE